MKKFAKKHLAIAVFMMAFGGMTNMAHADTTLYSKDVSADKEVKQGGAVKIEFSASPDEIISGKQSKDITAFVLKVSDSAQHGGWSMLPTGKSKGGYMYNDSGEKVELHSTDWDWDWRSSSDNKWYKTDSSNRELVNHLLIKKGDVVKAGVYHFTARVEEYA